MQECVSEFVSFITSEASERCHQEKRKTINGEDILFAMQSLGFDNYVEPLKLYLQKYRESMKGEKTSIILTDGDLFILGGEKTEQESPPVQKEEGSNSLSLFYNNSNSEFNID